MGEAGQDQDLQMTGTCQAAWSQLPVQVVHVMWTCSSRHCAPHWHGSKRKSLLGHGGLRWPCSCPTNNKEIGAFEYLPLLANYYQLSDCKGGRSLCWGGKCFSGPRRKDRKKWPVISQNVVPSLLWSNKLQICFHCWEARNSPRPFAKRSTLHAGCWQPPNAGSIGNYHCPAQG